MDNASHPSSPARYYFAAMNTAAGFCGRFREIFGSLEKLYIIKGGPGTGKSHFIRRLGAEAERHGRAVEYFFCSSDPTSLDGMIFTSQNGTARIGVIDGTSPHAYEPQLPGATENIIDLGAFWNAAELTLHKAELTRLNAAKSRLYADIYRYLSAIRELDTVVESTSSPCLKDEKLSAAIARLMRMLPRGDGYHESVRIRSAVSCNGSVRLDTYARLASHRYAIVDRAFTANIFMRHLREQLMLSEQHITVSYDPFSPDAPDAIYIPALDMSFYVGCENITGEKLINMTRFIDADELSAHRAALRTIYKLRRELLALMYTEYSGIAALHSELEAFYTSAMDFSGSDALCEALIAQLFPR